MKKLFDDLKKQNRAAFVLFTTCGDPSIEFTEKLVERVCAAGVDIVELGVPFSDPMADGKTIQEADDRALAGGASLAKVFDMVGRLRAAGVDKKFVLFSYYNPIFKFGLERAAEKSAQVGIDAWLVVDVPMEESVEITSVISAKGIDFIPLAAPTSSPERIAEISKCGGGFLYYASVAGITGVRASMPANLLSRLAEVRKASVLPVAVGFGISSPEGAHVAAQNADAVVVGSRFVDTVHKALEESGEDAALKAGADFAAAFVAAMRR